MLPRVVRGRNVFQQQLRHSTKLRFLPSQYPAVTRLHTRLSRPVSRPNKIPPSAESPSLPSRRNLATTLDSSATDHGTYIPFEGVHYGIGPDSHPSNQWSPSSWLPGGSELDASSLVIIDDLLQTKPKVFKRMKGFGGDETEMLANFDAAIKVEKFDRAATLLHRLAEYYPFHSSEYLELHNRYLNAMVSNMIFTRQNNLVWALQKWFEVDMPRGGVKPNATTCAIMIRMALRMLHGSKRDRTVRRYWEMTKTMEIEEEVLAVPILTELELGELSEAGTPSPSQIPYLTNSL